MCRYNKMPLEGIISLSIFFKETAEIMCLYMTSIFCLSEMPHSSSYLIYVKQTNIKKIICMYVKAYCVICSSEAVFDKELQVIFHVAAFFILCNGRTVLCKQKLHQYLYPIMYQGAQ